MYYGFDVGGTKIEFGVFNEQLERIATERFPTPTNNYDDLIDTLVSLILKYDEKLGIEGRVGLGLPGMENPNDMTVVTVNIPAANGKPLRFDIEKRIGRKIKIENDANCFALSEAWDDDLRDSPSVMGLILGTGFGGGLVYEGAIFSGRNHIAGELGHMRLPIDAWFHLGENAPLLDCGCGNKGCLDNYLSGRGFELLYQHYYHEHKKASDITQCYYEGEQAAVEFVEHFMELLAICLANIFNAMDPHVVVLGGGLSNFEQIYDEMPKRVPKHMLANITCPKLIKAKHGDSGGVRGAAFLNIKS